MKTIIVPRITASEEMNHRKKSYPKGHKAGNNAEKSHFGQTSFKNLNNQCKKLPPSHFAATHTVKRGNIHISQEFLNLYPPSQRSAVIKQLKVHEKTEHKIMYPKKVKQ